MCNIIKYKGKIHFDPVNHTKKHINQSSWKRIAMVMIDGDLCEYYSWFIEKRYSIILNKPLRGSHISFVNDSLRDMCSGLNCTEEEAENIWNEVKNKYDGLEVDIYLDLDVRSDSKHWWINIPNEYRDELHNIRKLLGLNHPFFGLHMSIGVVNEKNKLQSDYILSLINKKLIN